MVAERWLAGGRVPGHVDCAIDTDRAGRLRNRQVSRGVFGARGAVPHAHRARNASLNQDKNDMKRADLALSAEPRELMSVSAGDVAADSGHIPSTNTVLVMLGAV